MLPAMYDFDASRNAAVIEARSSLSIQAAISSCIRVGSASSGINPVARITYIRKYGNGTSSLGKMQFGYSFIAKAPHAFQAHGGLPGSPDKDHHGPQYQASPCS